MWLTLNNFLFQIEIPSISPATRYLPITFVYLRRILAVTARRSLREWFPPENSVPLAKSSIPVHRERQRDTVDYHFPEINHIFLSKCAAIHFITQRATREKGGFGRTRMVRRIEISRGIFSFAGMNKTGFRPNSSHSTPALSRSRRPSLAHDIQCKYFPWPLSVRADAASLRTFVQVYQ